MYAVWLTEMDETGKVLEDRRLPGTEHPEDSAKAQALVNEIWNWGVDEMGIAREETHIVGIQSRRIRDGAYVYGTILVFK
jgi:hypothetical protein